MNTIDCRAPLIAAALLFSQAAQCASVPARPDPGAGAVPTTGPDLDLSIGHYSRVMTAEGVLREVRFDDAMLRRSGHVWLSRVLPARREGKAAHRHEQEHKHEHKHEHPNYETLPRHIMFDGGKVRLEAVDAAQREVIAIPPAEFDNANFDGSWVNAFFLMNPQRVAALPLSQRASPVAGARWREQEKNGMFQRVLWDDARLIPLIVETGDRAGTVFERITVKPLPTLTKDLPWARTRGYAQREYADFLD